MRQPFYTYLMRHRAPVETNPERYALSSRLRHEFLEENWK